MATPRLIPKLVCPPLAARHASRRVAATALTLSAAAIAIAVVTACSRTAGGFENDKERLRYDLEQTQAALEQVRRERTELRAKLRELSSRLDAASGDAAADVIDAMPRAASLDFERLTSLVDRDGQPGFESVDVYLRPLDGRGRFVQVAGHMRVQAFLQPADAAGERELIAERVLAPADLRDAYRSTLLSVHYAVPLVFERPLAESIADRRGNGAVLLIARFDDAVTGLAHTATRELR
jgi:cell division protein FtsB